MISQIKLLNNNKAVGPSSIPVKILKHCKDHISIPLRDLINMSFSTGTFPSILKTANVIPVYKKGDNSICTNYRPISLLSNISKIIERLMHNRISFFLLHNSLLYNYQFGFRLNHSTNHALIEITEKIRKACDTGNFACGVYLDLQKAFDTVDHSILLKKLEYYGVKNTPLRWFQSFLVNRFQYTTVNGAKSITAKISHGVPQGSVLGPLLFDIFINDLHNAVKFSQVIHFADDTNLLISDNSLKRINSHINHDLKLLNEWLKANKLSLNLAKTELVIFKSKLKTITKHLNFRISGQKITPSKTVKYLGITLQDNLGWDIHINQLTMKLNRAIGLLSVIRHHVNKKLLRTIYHAIFNSHLNYGCQIWGQNISTVHKLEKLQAKALRIINFKTKEYPANILFQKEKILKLSDYIKFQNVKFVRDCLCKNTPKIFHNFFQESAEIHEYPTRAAYKRCLKIPTIKTTHYGRNSVIFQSSLQWNQIQQTHNVDITKEKFSTFKTTLYKNILDSYA